MLEGLESRLLLAGDVQVVVTGGNLVITGDDAGNDIVISPLGPNQMIVNTGPNSATTINGLAGPVLFTGITRDVRIQALDGDDTFELSGVTVPANLSFEGGAGTDRLNASGCTVNRNVTVRAGTGPDGRKSVWFCGTTVLGGVRIETGLGAWANFTFEGGLVARNIAVANRDGGGFFELRADMVVEGNVTVDNRGGFTNTTIWDGVRVGGNLTVRSRDGIDHFDLREGARVERNLTVNLGAGDSEIELDDGHVGGNLTVRTKAGTATWSLHNGSWIHGNARFDHGNGDSTMNMTGLLVDSLSVRHRQGMDQYVLSGSSFHGRLTIDNGHGGSLATWENLVAVDGHATIRGGDGTDELFIGGRADLRGNLRVDNGAGPGSTFSFAGTLAGSLTVRARDGDNNFLVNGGANVGGAVQFRSGGGSDRVRIDDTQFADAATFNLGDGNDTVEIEIHGANPGPTTSFAARVSVQAGDGDDTIVLGLTAQFGNLVIFADAATFDGGPGPGDVFAPLNAAFTVAPVMRNFG